MKFNITDFKILCTKVMAADKQKRKRKVSDASDGKTIYNLFLFSIHFGNRPFVDANLV